MSIQSLNSAAARTALVIRVFAQDGSILALTDFDEAIEFGGINHLPVAGTSFSAVERTADLAPDFVNLETSLQEGALTAEHIAIGTFDDARAELWRVDTEDPESRHLISVGTVGEIARNGDRVSLEFRSLAQGLSKTIGRVYQKSCDAALGDERCGVDLNAGLLRFDTTISAVSGLTVQLDGSPAISSGRYNLGTLEFMNGPLEGLRRSIRIATEEANGLQLTLWEALPVAPSAADVVSVFVGCDKQFQTCRDRFQNTQRFRGFPHIPGVDVLSVQGRRQ